MAFQEFTVTLVSKKQLTSDVFLYSFTCPSTFWFQAGQFVMLQCENGETTKFKSYSLLNPPSEKGKLDLCVKLIPGGFASSLFVDMNVGDSFLAKGPFGTFIFHPDFSCSKVYFIACGTGVAPFYSMLKEHLSSFPQKEFTLLFGVRTKKHLFLHEDFLSLERVHTHFTYLPCLSKDTWNGNSGRVSSFLPDTLSDIQFYLCGLKEMVLDVKELLLCRGVPSDRIFFERYT